MRVEGGGGRKRNGKGETGTGDSAARVKAGISQPLLQNLCLHLISVVTLQAKDSVPLLLYLSRCDVQSVKFAARKALSSLGRFDRIYLSYH